MYWLDTTILALLGLAALLGAWSGFVRQVVRLIAISVALVVSLTCNERVTAFLAQALEEAPAWAPQLLAYVGVFCAVWLTFFLFALLLERGLQEARMLWVNRLLGAAVGALKAALILGLALLAATAYLEEPNREAMQKSTCAPVLAQGARLVLATVPPEYRERLWEQLPALERDRLVGSPTPSPHLPVR
jgi:membrane protein required for colicin V production